MERLIRQLLLAIGEDPDRDGLVDTPARVARMWAEFLDHDPGKVETAFEHFGSDQMVVVSGMRVWSLCEHHMLPFWCDIACGYIPRNRVLGLSKFARLAWSHARRLQVQERLTQNLADDLVRVTGSPDVAVVATGEHLCMTMRGVRTPALMTSSVVRGVFRDDAAARDEFLRLADRRPRT